MLPYFENQNSFTDIVCVIKWFVNVALCRYPYFGTNYNYVHWENVSGVNNSVGTDVGFNSPVERQFISTSQRRYLI